jgi:hypothetical protein
MDRSVVTMTVVERTIRYEAEVREVTDQLGLFVVDPHGRGGRLAYVYVLGRVMGCTVDGESHVAATVSEGICMHKQLVRQYFLDSGRWQ